MAYDRYDTREQRSRWRDDHSGNRGRGEDRGFFERAGDEIASWFGDDDADRRRREDQRMQGPDYGRGRGFRDRGWERGEGRGYSASERDYNPSWRGTSARDRGFDRGRFEREDEGGPFSRSSYRGHGGGEGEYRGSQWGTEANEPGFERGSRPMFGGYTHSEGLSSGRGSREDRESGWDRGDYREGGLRQRHEPHYHAWRQRQIDEFDRDYDEYRSENQSRFESDFGNWRQRRMQKRGLLGQIREHMEVVGNDDQHVGTVDRTAGDRMILTKSDPESGGVHHSLSCSDIDRVEGDRVILDCSADQARERWRDENRSRALFEREDQGEMGDRVLDRSFEGTYR
jgi:hypothetical protein